MILDTEKCGICDAYAVEHFERRDDCLIASYGRFVYRMDLRAFVCPGCHRELGPDTVREKLLREITK